MIELRTLGSVELTRPTGERLQSVLAQPKRLALLAWLALEPGPFHRRDMLLAMFWPESDDERARAALRQALRFLRLSLGADVLVNRGDDEIGIAPGTLSCDAARLIAAARDGDHATVLALYRGDLLPGLYVSDAPEWERWLDGMRDRLRHLAARAAAEQTEACLARGDAAAAADVARRALDLAPQDEAALRRLMIVLDRAGQRAAALAAYDAFAARIDAEFGIRPSAETDDTAASIRSSSRDVPAAAYATPAATPAIGSPGPVHRPQSRRVRHATLVVAAVLLLVALTLVTRHNGGDDVRHPNQIVVAPFDNQTGDAALDPLGAMAADWIIQGLTGVGSLQVVPLMSTVVSVRYLESQVPSASVADVQRRLAHETGARWVVSGSYYRQGDQLHLQARVTDIASGGVVRALDPVVASVTEPIAGIEQLRAAIRAAVAPLADTTFHARAAMAPPTYEAYRDYITGLQAFVQRDLTTALHHFQAAAAGDSTYPMPLIAAAITYSNLGDDTAADSIAQRIARMRHRLGVLERNTLDMLQARLRGDDAAAYAAMAEAARLTPGTINQYMVAEQARRLNRPREAVQVLREMGPERGELRGWRPYWRELTAALHLLGDHSTELREATRARELFGDEPAMLLMEVRALAGLGRIADVNQRIEQRLAMRHDHAPNAGALMQAAGLELRAHGRRMEGDLLIERAVAWHAARPAGERTAAAAVRERTAALYAARRWDEAQAVFEPLASEAPDDVHVLGVAGTLAAVRGDTAAAMRAAERLRDAPQPYLRGTNTYWRACIASLLGEPEHAVRLLREAIGAGFAEYLHFHTDPDLAPLRGYPPFEALVRPAG